MLIYTRYINYIKYLESRNLERTLINSRFIRKRNFKKRKKNQGKIKKLIIEENYKIQLI